MICYLEFSSKVFNNNLWDTDFYKSCRSLNAFQLEMLQQPSIVETNYLNLLNVMFFYILGLPSHWHIPNFSNSCECSFHLPKLCTMPYMLNCAVVCPISFWDLAIYVSRNKYTEVYSMSHVFSCIVLMSQCICYNTVKINCSVT